MHTIDVAADTATDRIGTGHGASDDPRLAATEALMGALGGRMPRSGDLVFVFADIAFDAEVVMATLRSAAAPATVVGSSGQLSFTASEAGPHRLSVAYVPCGVMNSGAACVEAVGGDLYRAARDAAAEAKRQAGEEHPHSVLIVLTNHTGAQRDVVRGAYEITGARVPMVGGAATSNLDMDPTWQAVDDVLVTEGVAAVWLNSPEPLGVAVDHGWRPISRPLLVTSAKDNVVLELDGRPAVEAYLEARGVPLRDAEIQLGWEAVDLPFGLPAIGGGYEVRHIKDATDDGGLEMFGYIHDQAVLRVMSGEIDELLLGARRAVASALAQLERPSRGALIFSCTARLMLLGDRIDEERQAFAGELGDVAAAGFFTSGEYARTVGSSGFHNASVAVLAL